MSLIRPKYAGLAGSWFLRELVSKQKFFLRKAI
jgi:hypothetical protein